MFLTAGRLSVYQGLLLLSVHGSWIYCLLSTFLFYKIYTFNESKIRNVFNVIKKGQLFRGHLNAALADPVRAEETDTERSVIISRGNVSAGIPLFV